MIGLSESTLTMGIKIHKKLLALILLSLAFWGVASYGMPATAIDGFTDTQIKAAKNFSFSNGGGTVTGSIGGKSISFTGGTQLLQLSSAALWNLVHTTNPNPTPMEWKVSPSDVFCMPPGQNSSLYHNEFLIYPNGITLSGDSTNAKISSVSGYLVAFAGNTDAACSKNTSGSQLPGQPPGSNGVKVAVSVTTAPPKGEVITQKSLDSAEYAFGKNGSIINGTFKLANGKSKTLAFIDQQPYDDIPNFTPSDTSFFCTGGGATAGGLSYDPSSQGKSTIHLTAVALPVVTDSSGTCAQGHMPAAGSSVSGGETSKEIFSWQQNTLVTYGDKSPLTLQVDNQTGKGSVLYNDAVGGTCGNGSGWVVLLDSAKGNSGKLYHLTTADSGSVVNGFYNGCKADKSTPRAITIHGNWTAPPPDTGPTGNSTDCETQAATSNIAGHALAFVACPLLDGAQSFSDYLIGQVENLLSFTFHNNLGDSTQANQVKNAWSEIRDLASVFLVIIMLVMVLSQAISWGPFDAYTVRKVLPRIVIAVILMQVSWSLLDYVTRLFDDLGHGVADLMYGPFGGSGKLQLGAILQDAGIPAYAGGSVVLVSLIGIAAIAVLSLPTILLVGWSIVLALLVAFVTLAVRQILIITLIILAPLAMLLWILPNAQRYWKMWYDNFSKLLLMFPMIIGMIAAGRIFAYITSSGSNNTLIKFMLILIGYFGPFFLIPKTYKWGGQALAAASGAINNAAPKLGGPVTNYLKGTQERAFWHQARQARTARLGEIAKEKYGASLADRNVRTRAMHLGLTKNRDVLRRATISAQAEQRKLLQQRAQETVEPLVEEAVASGNWGRVVAMAQDPHATAQDRAAAIVELAKSRRFTDITNAGLHTTPQWEQLYNTNKDLKDAVDGSRIDLKPSNMAAGTPGQLAIGPAAGTSGVAGVSIEQLGAQSSDFFNLADAGVAAGADLDAYVGRLQELARTPNAAKIMGTSTEAAINATLQRHHTAHGGAGPAPTFTSLVQSARPAAPGTGVMPLQGPQVVAAAPGAAPTIGTQPITANQQAIFGENDLQVQARVQGAGGWGGMHEDDVAFIYQHKTGSLKDAAEAELRNRHIIP